MAGDPEADFVQMVTWIEANEYKRGKEVAFAATSTITGMKGDLTLLKGEIAGLAIGLTAVKFDYTLLKIDEKGISWRGRQLVGWKYADQSKSFQAKMERKQRKLGRAQNELKTRLRDFEKAQMARTQAATRAADANKDLTAAQRAANRPNRTFDDRVRLGEAETAAKRAAKALEKQNKAFEKQKKKAQELYAWTEKIRQEMEDIEQAKRDAVTFEKAMQNAQTEATKLKQALDRAAQSA